MSVDYICDTDKAGHRIDQKRIAVVQTKKNGQKVHRCREPIYISYRSQKIVSVFSMSWELQLTEHTLVADSPTRWGSMAKMVTRILEQENVIHTVISADRKASHSGT